MSLTLNMIGGGGKKDIGAAIRVLYKSGTISTCTSGQKTLRSDDSGDFIFLVPFIGDWTITGTDSFGVEKITIISVVKNDMKTVLLDSVIPPEYREYYRQVEYLKILDSTRASIPLITNSDTEDWYIKINKFVPEFTTANASYVGIVGNNNWNTAGYQAGGIKSGTSYLFGINATASSMAMSSGVSYSIKLVLKGNPELYVNDDVNPIYTHWDQNARVRLMFIGCNGASEGTPNGNAAPGYYYTAEIAQGNTIIGKYFPCVRIKDPNTQLSDNMPGYYDMLNNSFYQGVYCASNSSTPSRNTSDVITQIIAGPFLDAQSEVTP